MFVLIARPSWSRAIALIVTIALLLTSCGSQQSDESGVVSAETVKQLENLLRTRASAMARGDRAAFLQAIDTTRPAFRRTQLHEFDLPSARGTLNSSFKISRPEHYRGYIRGWVEETFEGNAFPGAFRGGLGYARRYFRSTEGTWILTEPTGDEAGGEKHTSSGDVELTYWGMDEDVAPMLLAELEVARAFALRQSPTPQQLRFRGAFIPTAELAGPAWDGFAGLSGGGGDRWTFYPFWYAFDDTRSHLAAVGQNNLRTAALDDVRNGIVPRVRPRLFLNRWLDDGWLNHVSGLDVTVILRQSCAGVPIPSLKELADGPPDLLGQSGVAIDVYGRYYAYATSMVAYLYEKYGVDAFWKLMMALGQNPSSATTFPAILKISPEDFYASWLIWLKKKYC